MGQVHNILEARPHMSGPAKCLACGHEWVTVCAVGESCLDCPSCGTWRGVMKGNTMPATRFECNCGCSHFAVMPNAVAMCCHCGLSHNMND